eukprot:jgi/Bigna1/55834/estExt_Genewise1Plus.C_720071
MSEENEIPDPKLTAEETCKPKCAAPWKAYLACAKRIEGDTSGEKHCSGWYFDYWKCIDKCATPSVFKGTK